MAESRTADREETNKIQARYIGCGRDEAEKAESDGCTAVTDGRRKNLKGCCMKQNMFAGYKDYPINLAVWDEVEGPVKGVVQILHGMVEHIGRYDEFGRFLNKNGYVALGDDHRGHGVTAQGRLGVVPEGDCFNDTVEDEILIGKYARETYDAPLLVFGHSYGSFLTQRYIQKSSEISAAVLCGSACMDIPDVKAGLAVANMQAKIFGKDKEANLIRGMSFGPYNAQFKAEKKENAWLTRDDERREKYNADPMCNYTMSIGFYTSFFAALRKLYAPEALSGIPKELPVYIISGDKDPVGGNGKLINKLYEVYKDNGLLNVSVKLYPDARHELLNELNRDEVMADVLNFYNGVVDTGKEKEE